MSSDILCRKMNDLGSCLRAPIHCVPTVNFTVRNGEAPLTSEDYNFWNQPEVNFFTSPRRDADRGRYAKSRQLSDQTLTMDTDFILLGFCVYAYGEPMQFTADGNWWTPQAAMLAQGELPASPINQRNIAALRNALFASGSVPDGATSCPAKLEYGGPIQRAIWAFLHGYRAIMRCPGSNLELIMDEALADIGNCCSQAQSDGYGDTDIDQAMYVRRFNDMLQGNAPFDTRGALRGNVDPGVFVPVNCEQFADGDIVPQRDPAQPVAYGRIKAEAAVEQWYKLPCPIPLDATTKIKITLEPEEGDDTYRDRFLNELTLTGCQGPVPGLTNTHPINEEGTRTTDGGVASRAKLPGGQYRFGIGLKGFEVKTGVCNELRGLIGGKSLAQIAAAHPELMAGGCGVVQTDYNGTAGGCIPAGLMGKPEGM
jgi:hypothetical protein